MKQILASEGDWLFHSCSVPTFSTLLRHHHILMRSYPHSRCPSHSPTTFPSTGYTNVSPYANPSDPSGMTSIPRSHHPTGRMEGMRVRVRMGSRRMEGAIRRRAARSRRRAVESSKMKMASRSRTGVATSNIRTRMGKTESQEIDRREAVCANVAPKSTVKRRNQRARDHSFVTATTTTLGAKVIKSVVNSARNPAILLQRSTLLHPSRLVRKDKAFRSRCIPRYRWTFHSAFQSSLSSMIRR